MVYKQISYDEYASLLLRPDVFENEMMYKQSTGLFEYCGFDSDVIKTAYDGEMFLQDFCEEVIEQNENNTLVKPQENGVSQYYMMTGKYFPKTYNSTDDFIYPTFFIRNEEIVKNGLRCAISIWKIICIPTGL